MECLRKSPGRKASLHELCARLESCNGSPITWTHQDRDSKEGRKAGSGLPFFSCFPAFLINFVFFVSNVRAVNRYRKFSREPQASADGDLRARLRLAAKRVRFVKCRSTTRTHTDAAAAGWRPLPSRACTRSTC